MLSGLLDQRLREVSARGRPARELVVRDLVVARRPLGGEQPGRPDDGPVQGAAAHHLLYALHVVVQGAAHDMTCRSRGRTTLRHSRPSPGADSVASVVDVRHTRRCTPE